MAEKFNRATFTRSFLRNITRIKAPDEMLAEAKAQGLEKTLGVVDLIVLGVGTLLFVKYKKYIGVFVFYVLFMTVISAFATEEFYEVDYKFGQEDLVTFAKYAKDYDYKISSFGLDRKYSLLYYNDEKVDYNSHENLTPESVKEDLAKDRFVVIIKNKQLPEIEGKVDYEILKSGRRWIF